MSRQICGHGGHGGHEEQDGGPPRNDSGSAAPTQRRVEIERRPGSDVDHRGEESVARPHREGDADESGEAVVQMLEELHAGGSTICIATKNPRYIARTTRRIYLVDGRVVPEPVA